ncbi:hypothetical protein SODALDRAFT_330864 [Sodiomyces alkalinus F11]|uniref:Decapping nuclease n=1 Tax=Sodiomyces alkalinus (strain CBS 110278 / VKM F-3762 / F11) TaxID=1314773 RepID=A0A3N2Q317_SODAK|nr:hypothetical protein SODALDRAFT_330864 [Sodiomyces alkalinus F11]ROT41153.1 hypothetical protein SODALDRAFT_330864 [Sodiomyces alkalinus F11]
MMRHQPAYPLCEATYSAPTPTPTSTPTPTPTPILNGLPPLGSVHALARGKTVARTAMANLEFAELHSGQPNSADALQSYIPRLWFSRSRSLIVGYRSKDTVERVDIFTSKTELVAWEEKEKNQEALRKLVTLLSELKKAVQGMRGDQAGIVVFDAASEPEPRTLCLFEANNDRRTVPSFVETRFWNWTEKHPV